MRSQFGGELNALLDAAENVLLLQLAFHEILHGSTESQEVLMDRLEAGNLDPPIDMVTDCASVFEAIKAAEVGNPSEASLKLHLLSIRNRMERGVLRSLYWTDTRNMLADGLTKGECSRSILQRAMHHGKLTIAKFDNPTRRCQRT